MSATAPFLPPAVAPRPAAAGSAVVEPAVTPPPAAALPVRLALLLIRAYQLWAPHYLKGHCRYAPSCSQYAREALERHGLARGLYLAARRIARCHPLGASGYDPVP
jgi:putative membrane protein insertion efficiency factor